jgi:hypothetical protein
MKHRVVLSLVPGIAILLIAQHSLGLVDARQSGEDLPKPGTFKLDAALILDIGKEHPRFAATLANQNIFGIQFGKARVNWTPIELTSAEIPAYLDKPAHKAFFEDLEKRSREINLQVEAGKISPILYEENVSRASPHDVVLELNVVKGWEGDPPFRSLVLRVSGVNPADGFIATKDNTHWRLR